MPRNVGRVKCQPFLKRIVTIGNGHNNVITSSSHKKIMDCYSNANKVCHLDCVSDDHFATFDVNFICTSCVR